MTAKEKVLKECPDAVIHTMPDSGTIRVVSRLNGIIGICCIARESWAWADAVEVIKRKKSRGDWREAIR